MIQAEISCMLFQCYIMHLVKEMLLECIYISSYIFHYTNNLTILSFSLFGIISKVCIFTSVHRE